METKWWRRKDWLYVQTFYGNIVGQKNNNVVKERVGGWGW